MHVYAGTKRIQQSCGVAYVPEPEGPRIEPYLVRFAAISGRVVRS